MIAGGLRTVITCILGRSPDTSWRNTRCTTSPTFSSLDERFRAKRQSYGGRGTLGHTDCCCPAWIHRSNLLVQQAALMPPWGRCRPGRMGNDWLRNYHYETRKSKFEDYGIVFPQIESHVRVNRKLLDSPGNYSRKCAEKEGLRTTWAFSRVDTERM